MGKKTIVLVMILVLATPLFIFSQIHPGQTTPLKPSKMGVRPRGFLESLLDPSRFSMSHSYSVSMFSVGGQTMSQGLYLNTMDFKFSDPLTMQVSIGYLHQPFGGMDSQNPMNGKVFLERARLEYKPSDKTYFSIDFRQYPGSMMSPYYYRPGGYYPLRNR